MSRVRMGNQAVTGFKEQPAAPTVVKTDEQWRASLTPQQYTITRLHGTDRPFSHPYTDTKEKGIFKCIGCGTPLFESDDKFDSGCGWPSFSFPVGVTPDTLSSEKDPIRYITDTSAGMVRTEVRCRACEAHQGHVFNDGPTGSGRIGLRYCINGSAIKLEPKGSGGGGSSSGDGKK